MPEHQQYDYQRARYEAYVSEKKSLNDALLEISGRHTQWLCTLSGGSLAVSITFLEKIAPHPLPATTDLLLLAWVALIVSLCTVLLSIHYSNNEVFNRIQSLEQDYAAYRQSLDDPSGAAVLKLISKSEAMSLFGRPREAAKTIWQR